MLFNDPSRDVIGAVRTTVGCKHTAQIVREVDSVLSGREGEICHVCLVGQQYGKAMDDFALNGLDFESSDSTMCQG